MKKKYKISKSELKRLYTDNQLSIKQIANKLGVSYWKIWKSMKIFGIKARTLSEANTLNNLQRKISIPKKILEELYSNKRLSSLKIAKIYNCHHSVILNRLKEHNIKRRDAVESNTKYLKKNFNGSQEDKAYMLGFALGDLNIVKPNKNGRTLIIQGNSTIPEQINLIEDLFKNYGPIQTKNVKGFTKEERITINLNDSFDFLLYKKDNIPEWILLNKNDFFAFLAGYIDAEGNIKTTIPTWLTINGYNKGILNQIKENLEKYGFNAKLRISAKKGYTSTKHTKPYKKDVWQTGIYSKKDLLKLFVEIKPHLKHKNKVNAMLKSIEQINHRNKEYGNQRM